MQKSEEKLLRNFKTTVIGRRMDSQKKFKVVQLR